MARVLRDTIDQLLDGQHTGRYRWETLRKTEKTHAGTLVEINLQRALDFADGIAMDYSIAGEDVDCKFSQVFGGWEIPPEAWEGRHICLLVWAHDVTSAWRAGLIRAEDDVLRAKPNRDGKRQLSALGRQSIVWLWDPPPALPENVLLHLDVAKLERIFALRYGNARVLQLFREVQGRVIGRGVIATVAQQDDPMRRVRGNGGARTPLAREGILILGQYARHRAVARDLGLPLPGPGETVSARVARVQQSDPRHKAQIGEHLWAVAQESDPVEQAPHVPYHEPERPISEQGG